MGSSRRKSNGRSPPINHQPEITSFFSSSSKSKSTSSPILSNPNPNTPSPRNNPLLGPQHQHSTAKKLFKRLRKMVIEEDDEVEQIPQCDDDHHSGDDEDCGKNVAVEDNNASNCEQKEDMELEEKEEEEVVVAKGSKRKPSGKKVEPGKRNRKLGGTEKLEPLKKSKNEGEEALVVDKGGFELSHLDLNNNNTNLERRTTSLWISRQEFLNECGETGYEGISGSCR